jgi:hypothetical protein
MSPTVPEPRWQHSTRNQRATGGNRGGISIAQRAFKSVSLEQWWGLGGVGSDRRQMVGFLMAKKKFLSCRRVAEPRR